jgi:sugar phosphate isomerase/epimerase
MLGGATLDELIIAATGHYAAITVAPNQFVDAIAAGQSIESIRAQLHHAGLVVDYVDPVVVGLPGLPDPGDIGEPELAALFDYDLSDGLRAAAALEAGSLGIAHLLGDPAVGNDALLTALRPMARAAAAASVRLLLEFIPGTGIGSLETAATLAASLSAEVGGRPGGPPAVGVTFDTWHFARSGGRTSDITADRARHVGAIQLSDGIPGPRDEIWVPGRNRLLPGDGRLELAAQVERIHAASPAAHIGVEVISEAMRSYEFRTAAEVAARASLAVLSSS